METPVLHSTRNCCKTGLAIVGPYCEAGSEATPGQHKLLQPAKEPSRLPQRLAAVEAKMELARVFVPLGCMVSPSGLTFKSP